MDHPLDGAIERVRRSRRHSKTLTALIGRTARSYESEVIASNDPGVVQGDLEFSIKETDWPRPVPPGVQVLVSEAVFNLRCALDYLVYELAKRDSGQAVEQTQFPICDNPAQVGKQRGFREYRNKALRGVSDQHVALIETFQPYNGAAWAATLRDISNSDKHKTLVLVGNFVQGEYLLTSKPAGGRLEHGTRAMFERASRDGQDVHAQAEYALRLLIDGRIDVVAALRDIQREVSATIEAFRTAF